MPGDDLDDITAWGSYFVTAADASQVLNLPKQTALQVYVLLADSQVTSERRMIQVAVDQASNADTVFIRKHRSTGWSSWEPLAIATPPEEYGLPLAEGLTGNSYYSKTQEGLVLVRISIVVSQEVGAQAVIGTLPAGYRPANDVAVSALAGVSGEAIATPLGIYANGTIMNIGQAIPAGASNRVYGEAIFIAAN